MGKGDTGITPCHITGLAAIIVSTYFLITYRNDFTIVAASIYFTLACTTDTFKAKIPNVLNASLIVAGIVISTLAMGVQGLLLSLSGLVVGVVLLLLPYLMGGMGAGDVKALGALGALIGPYDLLHVFVYMALFGGALALIHFFYHQTDIKKTLREGWHSLWALVLSHEVEHVLPSHRDPSKEVIRFPYASAIALGYYSFVQWGSIF